MQFPSSHLDIPPAKRVHHNNPQKLAGSSLQYESDDSDSLQQCDGENSEIYDDTSQQNLIATSSQVSEQSSNFNKKYEELITVSSKWYDLGLALGLDNT